MITALVTGIGGTRSIAVMKALRMSTQPIRVIGTDANYFNAGSFQADVSYILPLASDPGYIEKLKEIIKDEQIDIVFGTVEKEVTVLSEHKVELEALGVSVAVPEKSILEICFDKYKTQEFLKNNDFTNIPCIYSDSREAINSFVQESGLPIIRKPVFGYGSKGLSIARTPEEVAEIPLDNTYVIQKFIDNEDTEKFYNTELNEYTAEVFVNTDGSIAGGIIIKRALHAGETVAGYVVKDQVTIDYLAKIAKALKIKGACNFQFRKAGGKIFVFEINPLFSGTTAARASIGFNSVLLAVNSFVKSEHGTISQDQLADKYFLRYLDEVYIDPSRLNELHEKRVIRND